MPTERFFSIDRVKVLVRRDKKILRREEERERETEKKKYNKVVVEVGKKMRKWATEMLSVIFLHLEAFFHHSRNFSYKMKEKIYILLLF